MAETLNRETLTPKDKDFLEKVLVKNPADMTEDEKAVIRSRRVYLTPIELATFEEVLDGEDAAEDDEKVSYSAMTVAELKTLCEEREIKIPEGAKKADIVELIERLEVHEE